MTIEREAFFLESAKGNRFCLVTRPRNRIKGAILYLPPFAEELNKSRRMSALSARAFAQNGWLVMQLDLFGCGDSDGDFSEAAWSDWLDDLTLGWRWLTAHTSVPISLWSLRTGALLGAEWLATQTFSPSWLIWQPVLNGQQYLTQYLRLKTANDMLADKKPSSTQALRAIIEAGENIEIAGYTLNPTLFNGLNRAMLDVPASYSGMLSVCEVNSTKHIELSPALTTLINKWNEKNINVSANVITGPAFWQTAETEEAPLLIDHSVLALQHFPHE